MAEPKSRLELLGEMAAKDPKNAFARYGYAMELGSNGRLEEAAEAFRALARDLPAYVPTYYHAGKACEKLAKLDDARDFYRRGIEAATQARNFHAREELEGALALLD